MKFSLLKYWKSNGVLKMMDGSKDIDRYLLPLMTTASAIVLTWRTRLSFSSTWQDAAE